MLEHLKKQSNLTLTENGAAAYRSTLSECLDLFATIGALRHREEIEIARRFIRAYAENAETAMKLLFFARDIREGLGERKVFRTCLKFIAHYNPESARKNIPFIAEYGRFDDILVLLDTPVRKDALDYIRDCFFADVRALATGGRVNLLGKWLPSVNASSEKTVAAAKMIARHLNLSFADYRNILTKLRARIHIIENDLRTKNYTFDYSKQPSVAMLKYRKAFERNDKERFTEFLKAVRCGERTVNTSAVYPYQLVEPLLMHRLREEEKEYLNTAWYALPEYECNENVLAVIDTSGSMYSSLNPAPISVALSLGLYFAEHNKGTFANHFMIFSKTARLLEVKGESFTDKIEYLSSFSEIANTNLEQVFDLVLETAVKNRLLQSELPSKMVIISDMEFDVCVENADGTVFENAGQKFEQNGYKLPEIVFWNVDSRNAQQPVTKNDKGVYLVSGCTPRLFNMVANGDLHDVYAQTLMLDILYSKRYQKICA